MIFGTVRKVGFSHNEIENDAADDLAAGCAVLLRAMVNAARGIGMSEIGQLTAVQL